MKLEYLGFNKNYDFNSLLCMPIRNLNNEIIAVTLLINKQNDAIFKTETAHFTENDIRVIFIYFI